MSPEKKVKTSRHYTLKEKYEAIIEHQEQNVAKHEIYQKYGVTKSVFNRWLQKSDKIKASYSKEYLHDHRRLVADDPLSKVKDAVEEWMDSVSIMPPSDRPPLTGMIIGAKAVGFAAEMLSRHERQPFLSDNEVKHMKNFKGSEQWGRKFSRACGYTSVAVNGSREAGSGDSASIKDHREDTRNNFAQYAPNNLFNMDETGYNYQALNTSSRAKKHRVPESRQAIFATYGAREQPEQMNYFHSIREEKERPKKKPRTSYVKKASSPRPGLTLTKDDTNADSTKKGVVQNWLKEALPHLHDDDLTRYTSRLVEDGFDSVELLETDLVEEDMDFMKKAHRRALIRVKDIGNKES